MIKRLGITGGVPALFGAAALVASLLLPCVAHSQALAVPAPIEVRFDIARYVAEGNTLLPPDEIERLLQPFVGRQRDFGTYSARSRRSRMPTGAAATARCRSTCPSRTWREARFACA